MAGLRALDRAAKHTRDLDEVANIYDSFKDPYARAAIRHVVRAVVDWRGQIVTMADRAYLTEAMPMCVVWGRDEKVIPVRHANHVGDLAPKARVEVIPNAGHFPHKDHPLRFAKIVHEFIRTTQPATYSRGRFRALLKSGQAGPGPTDGHGHPHQGRLTLSLPAPQIATPTRHFLRPEVTGATGRCVSGDRK